MHAAEQAAWAAARSADEMNRFPQLPSGPREARDLDHPLASVGGSAFGRTAIEGALVRGICNIVGVAHFTDQQRVQARLPLRHGGMGLRHFSKDIMIVARLSSAALAHAALAGGSDAALPFTGAMGIEANGSLTRLQEAWPSVKGLADGSDDAAEWAGRKQVGKALRMVALQRALMQTPKNAQLPSL